MDCIMDFRTIKVPRDSGAAEYVFEEIMKLGRHESIVLDKDLMHFLLPYCTEPIPCKGDNSVMYQFKNSNGKLFAFETADINTNTSWFQITATFKSPFYTYQAFDGIPVKFVLES